MSSSLAKINNAPSHNKGTELLSQTLKRNNNFKYISILQVVVPNVLTEVTEEEEEGAEKKKKPRKLKKSRMNGNISTVKSRSGCDH